MDTMEQFLGKKYKLMSSENFEEYLKFIDVPYVASCGQGAHKAGCVASLDGNAYPLREERASTMVTGGPDEIGFFSRKAAQAASPVSCLECNADGTYTFSVTSPIKSSIITFRLGEEFVETRLDGAKVKTTMTIEGNKLIQIQVEESGRKTTNLREFTPEFLVVTTTAEGWDGKCVRSYEVVQ